MPFDEQPVELHFPLIGSYVPSDHGYLLYSAISHQVSEAHASNLGIHTIRGVRFKPGTVRLSGNEHLRIRLPLASVPALHKLAGVRLNIGGYELRCGIPRLHLLVPSPTLRSRLVVIKTAKSSLKRLDPAIFLSAVTRQLEQLGVAARASLELSSNASMTEEYARRIVTIKKNTIAGYGVIIEELGEQDSLLLQAVGIGGRRHMGCGLFVPVQQRETLTA